MSLKLQKLPNPKNAYDLTTVTIELPTDVTRDQLLEVFGDFLKAIGYHVGGPLVVDEPEEAT